MQVNRSSSLRVKLCVERFRSSSNRICRGRVWTPGSKNNHLPSTGSLGAGRQPMITTLSSTEGGRASERSEGESKVFISCCVVCCVGGCEHLSVVLPLGSFVRLGWEGGESPQSRPCDLLFHRGTAQKQAQAGRSKVEVQLWTVLARQRAGVRGQRGERWWARAITGQHSRGV